MSKESWRSLKKVRMDRRALSTSPQGSLFVKSMPANIKKISLYIQVNLCQKLFFLQNMLCTEIVLNVRNNFCAQHVLPRFELAIFMY